jgi:hypothetical protein
VIVCKVCGQQNAESESFCTNCGAFLDRGTREAEAPGSDTPAAEPAGGTAATPEPEPQPGAEGPSSADAPGTSDEEPSRSEPGPAEPGTGTTTGGAADTAGTAAAGGAAAGAGAGAAAAGATPPSEKIIIRSQKPPTGTARQPPSGEPDRQVDPAPEPPTPGGGDAVIATSTHDPNEIICPTCGRANTLDRTFCKYCSSLLRPQADAGPVVPPPPRTRIALDGRTGAIAAVAVAVVLIALAAIFLRPGDDPRESNAPSVSPTQSVPPETPPPTASPPVESQPPESVPPSVAPSPTPPTEPQGMIAFHTLEGDDPAEIWTIDLDTDDADQVTTAAGRDWDPDLSWDGAMLTWASPEGIRVSEVDGDDEYQLTHHGEQDINPAWNPDGDRIAFSSTRDGRWEVYVREAFDGASDEETITLTSSDAADYEPSWSPDGNEVVFTRGLDQKADIYRVAVPLDVGDEVEKPVPLTTNDDANIADEDPAWSPDGTKIAFSRTPDNGQADLWILDLETDEANRLTRTSGIEEHDPAWSPDGAFLAYQADGVIEIVDATTGEIVTTLELPGRASHASWR